MRDETATLREALHVLDRIVAERPEKVGHDFSEATRKLCAARDVLIARRRAEGETPEIRAALERVNGVISAVLAGHFPLQSAPWDLVTRARDEVRTMLGL